ncbi:MAG TPA: 1,2-phenylacetyl-CoA epoxidase subunit PaaD [Bacteroidota bacterium]|nr:1,2-phenylacetyl-CoA epoxidase subunit PaaD [Bacteroidota bacterium]
MQTVSRSIHQEAVWELLGEIPDPEIPTISITDLKIVRNVAVEGASVTVVLTPTFSGCPALDHMRTLIEEKLRAAGFETVNVTLDRSLPWSSDLLTESVKEKLRSFGIAPPPKRGENLAVTLSLPVACPYCGSAQTTLENEFGPTLCRQIFYCQHCSQSFERFKPL